MGPKVRNCVDDSVASLVVYITCTKSSESTQLFNKTLVLLPRTSTSHSVSPVLEQVSACKSGASRYGNRRDDQSSQHMMQAVLCDIVLSGPTLKAVVV